MNEKLPRTYIEVAEKAGLTLAQAVRFVNYMRERWPESEETKSGDGYAMEWAMRFKGGIEYAASDMHGRVILERLERMDHR